MAKKLLALLLAMCMIFSVCAVNVFAEDADESGTDATEATNESETETDTENDTTAPATEDEDEDITVEIDVEKSYLPNATVVVTGDVTGNVSGVIVEITCEEDDVEISQSITVKKFKSTGVTLKLDDATVGAEYVVKVFNFEDEDELLAETSFFIKKAATGPVHNDDGSNKVTIWIDGLTDRYIDETTVSLDAVKDATVLEVAKYVLDEAERNYKLSADKSKIDRIATAVKTSGTTTYLRDGYGTGSSSSSKTFADCEWGYFINGVACYDVSMKDMEVNGGDEIILYFGEPGEVGYPVVTITPENGIGLNDTVEILVENQITDVKTGEVTKEPLNKAKVYLKKRGATSIGSAKTTNNKGIYSVKATSSFISSYQGGSVLVAGYQSTSKPITMVSVEEDILTERDGYVRASITVEGAHKTLLETMTPSTSSKISEYDLLNYTIQVFKSKKIEYELNDDENNFTYIEAKTTKGYSNENGDLTKNSGWYVSVNGDIYTPDDDLEEVDVFTGDEIVYYFGDDDTVYAYYKIDGELKTDETVYVYFYSDPELTDPIKGLTVYFEGDDINKKYTTNSDGRIKLATVDYKGTYELSWGEQVDVKDDYCPEAVYREVELTYTGASKSNTSGTTSGTTTGNTSNKNNNSSKKDDDDNDDDDKWVTTKPTEKATEPDDEPWNKGDYTEPTETTEFVPGPSKYYPDTNIDQWAVSNVNKAHEYGLMSGTALGWFEPLREITRAEFTAIVCRILGLDTEADFTQKFTDVTPNDWHYKYVMAAYQAGYVYGVSDTTFAPSNYITREEIAVMVSRILNVTGDAASVAAFADGNDVANWAKIYVAAVNQTGIMTGDQFGQFLPKSKVNRQTVATIAVRVYEYLGNK